MSEQNVVGDKSIVQILNVRNGQAANVNQVIYVGVKPVTLEHILKGCQLQVHSAITSIRHKYNPDLYVKRVIEQEIAQFLDSSPGLNKAQSYLLVAPAGSGKTNLLSDLARTRADSQPTILLLGGSCYLGAETGLLGAIRAELENANSDLIFRSASDAFHCLCRASLELERNTLILIDAINEHEDPLQMRKAIANLLIQSSGKPIKLVITCRDYYWNIFKGQFWEEKTFNVLPDGDEYESNQFYNFSLDEHRLAVKLYFRKYEITGNLSGNALDQCRHPLLLRFFCEAYRGQDIGTGEIRDIRLKELFDQYWRKKLASIAERRIQQGEERLYEWLVNEVSSYLLHLASYMLHHNVRTIPLLELSTASGIEEDYASMHSIFGRIRDEYIILEEKQFGSRHKRTVYVAFVYEEFMEYVMALSLIHDWDNAALSAEEILNQISELTKKYDSFVQIFGVIVYLALMLKETHKIALWHLLLQKGSEWQNAIFEAVRKLPAEQLDEGVFDALAEMLRSNDSNVVIKVIDALKLERIGKTAPGYFVELVGNLIRLGKYRLNPRFEGEALQVSRRATLALRNLPANLVVPFLVRGFLGMKSDVYRNAQKTLIELGQSAVDPLVSLFQNRNLDDQIRATMEEKDALLLVGGHIRAAIAETLGEIGDSRAIPPLVNSLKEERDTWIFWHVRDALAKLDWSPMDDEHEAWRLVSQGCYRECVLFYKAFALKPLLHMLDIYRSHDDGRDKIIQALGELGDQGAVEPLLALLEEPYIPKQVIIEVLGKLGDLRVFESLRAKLKSKSLKERRSAATALGHLGDACAVDSLIALKTNDMALKLAQIESLGKLGDKRATMPLIGFLENGDASIRRQTIISLGALRDNQAVQPLITALKDENEDIRAEAATALGRLEDPRVVQPLIDALKDDSLKVKLAVKNALSLIGTPEALAAATEHSLPKEPRPQLVIGMGGTGLYILESVRNLFGVGSVAGGTGSGSVVDIAKLIHGDIHKSADPPINNMDTHSTTTKGNRKRQKRKKRKRE